MEIVHCGFDQLDVAFMGKMRRRTLSKLLAVKEEARAAERPVATEINGVNVTVAPNGTARESGYALILDLGPLEFVLRVKRSDDETQWNLFVESRSHGLATRSFDEQVARIYEGLKALDCVVVEESVNRFDYAVDFAFKARFQPVPSRFVYHAKCNTETHEDDEDDRAFSRNGIRTIRGITMGKNPGRQVQLYDKRHEQRSKQKTAWYEIWGTTKDDCPEMWRVELRSFKRDLDQWNIKTLDQLRAKSKDVMLGMLRSFKYVETTNISNISRAKLDPLWLAVTECVDNELSTLSDHKSHVRGRIVECIREDAIRQNQAQISGLVARHTHLHEMADDEVNEMAPQLAFDIVNFAVREPQFQKCRDRSKDRTVFLAGHSTHQQFRRAA